MNIKAEKAIEDIISIVANSELKDAEYTTNKVKKGITAFERKNSTGARNAVVEFCECLINLLNEMK